MYKSTINLIICSLLSFVLVSCNYCSKFKTKLKLDIAFLAKPDFCSENKVSNDVVDLYKPYITKDDKIGILTGKIFQLSGNPIGSIEILGSSSSWVNNTRKSLFGDKETIDQVNNKYKDYMSSLNIDSICQTGNNNAIEQLNSLIQTNRYTHVFVLAKTLKAGTWNEFPVFESEDLLKTKIKNLYDSAKESNILVLIEPVGNNETTTKTIVPKASCEELGAVLLTIATSQNYAERTAAKDSAVLKYFSDTFSVTLRYDDPKSEAVDRFEQGVEYLDKLAAEFHVSDIKVIACTKDGEKINHIDVVEIRKNDIDVKPVN